MKRPAGALLPRLAILLAALALALYRLRYLLANTGGAWGWDFSIYAGASQAFAGENPYLPFAVGTGFLNHPVLILLAAPFGALGVLGRWAWILTLGGLWSWFWIRLAGRSGLGPAALLPFLLWTPAVEAVFMGQASLPAALLLFAAFHLEERGRSGPSGAALGAAVLLKSSLAVFFIYLLARRSWRSLAAAAAMVVAASAVCELIFYRGITLDFLHSQRLAAELVHPGVENASLIPLMGRVVALPISAIFLALLLFFAIRSANHLGPSGLQEGYAAWSLLFSPLTWQHHFLWLFEWLVQRIEAAPVFGWMLFFLVQSDLPLRQAGFPLHAAALAAGICLVLAVSRAAALEGQ